MDRRLLLQRGRLRGLLIRAILHLSRGRLRRCRGRVVCLRVRALVLLVLGLRGRGFLIRVRLLRGV